MISVGKQDKSFFDELQLETALRHLLKNSEFVAIGSKLSNFLVRVFCASMMFGLFFFSLDQKLIKKYILCWFCFHNSDMRRKVLIIIELVDIFLDRIRNESKY